MSHFYKDAEAIVNGYNHNKCQIGNEWEHNYSLHIKGQGHVSWYHNFNLTLIKRNQFKLLEKWKAEEREVSDKESNPDWIFSNGKGALKGASNATLTYLGNCLGVSNLWGSYGEGWSYYCNAMKILTVAKPYLIKNDKDGWIKFCKKVIVK